MFVKEFVYGQKQTEDMITGITNTAQDVSAISQQMIISVVVAVIL